MASIDQALDLEELRNQHRHASNQAAGEMLLRADQEL